MGRFALAVLAVALLLAGPAVSAAHPGHDHKLMGTVNTIDAKKIAMKTTDGKAVTFTVTDATRFLNGKSRGALTELKAGMRVVVNVGDGKEPFVAREVQYTTAPPTAR